MNRPVEVDEVKLKFFLGGVFTGAAVLGLFLWLMLASAGLSSEVSKVNAEVKDPVGTYTLICSGRVIAQGLVRYWATFLLDGREVFRGRDCTLLPEGKGVERVEAAKRTEPKP